MEYRAKGQFEWLSSLLLNGLTWVGVAGIGWNMLKPGGWLYRAVDLIERFRPNSFYYVGAVALAALGLKVWLDRLNPYAVRYLLTACCAFAGSFYLFSLLLPL